jgi:hypothetical protein
MVREGEGESVGDVARKYIGLLEPMNPTARREATRLMMSDAPFVKVL